MNKGTTTNKMSYIIFVVLFALIFVISSSASAKKLKVTTPWAPPAQCMVSESVQMYLDELTKRTNGELTFEVFWGCALGTPLSRPSCLLVEQ